MCRECASNAMLVPVPAESFFAQGPKPPRAPATPTSARIHSDTGTLHMRHTLGFTHAPRALRLMAGAVASAASGATVKQVDVMIDGTIVGTATAAPYTVSWDSTTVSDGSHALTGKVTDNQMQTATSAALTISVKNNPVFSVTIAPAQIFPAPASSATGTASLTVKLASGATSGKVTLSGVTATAVTLNEAFAGATGAGVITLAANGGTAGEWDVPAGALLTADQVTALLQGKLYLIATSAANPAGEIRGQISPDNVTVIFSDLAGSQ